MERATEIMEKRISTADVMRIYGVSEKTIWEWKRNYAMPYRKIGKNCFFVLSELQEWDQAHRLPRVSRVPRLSAQIKLRPVRTCPESALRRAEV